jgi:hypothetical protein
VTRRTLFSSMMNDQRNTLRSHVVSHGKTLVPRGWQEEPRVRTRGPLPAPVMDGLGRPLSAGLSA